MNNNSKCKICDSYINSFMTFGNMPIANGFLEKKDFDNEYFYEMQVSVCDNCLLRSFKEPL